MKKILFLSLLVPFFSLAEIWVDYEPAEQVTEMTVVKVKPNMLDDYLMGCLLYTSPSPRDGLLSRMPSSA